MPAGRGPQAGDDEGRLQAGQEPAGARPVGTAEEGEVGGSEGTPGGERRVAGDLEEERLPGVAAEGFLPLRRDGEPAEEDALVLAEGRRLRWERVATDADDRGVRGVAVQPGAGGGELGRASCRERVCSVV